MSSPSYELRPCRPEDFAFLWALKCATMRLYVEKTWGRWDEAEQEDYFPRGLAPEIARIIVVDGCDAGRLDVTRQDNQIYLSVIELRPELQGRGIGSAIVRDLQTEAKDAKLPLRLQVLKTNPAAQRLYERLGFQHTGATESHHLMACLP
jgi:ribosomal protein S18 acetylase RimI-like enzyme